MSRPKVYSPATPPPAAPTDLLGVDTELKSLGYKEGGTPGGYVPPKSGPASVPGLAQQIGRQQYDAAQGASNSRIQELLGYRKKFLAAEDKIRTTTPQGRNANIMSTKRDLMSTPNYASRALIGS